MFSKNEVLKTENASKNTFSATENNNFYTYMRQKYIHFLSE